MAPPIQRLAVILPLVLSIVSIVLTSLALFAGHYKGFMEDYAIVRLNTSMIGENMLKSNDKPKDGKGKGDDDSLLDTFKNKWHDIKGDATGKLGGIAGGLAGDLAGDLADQLGVADWYSVHVMNSCEGNFGPNATELHFQLNTTNCTSSNPAYRLNLTGILDHELSIGPFDINLAKINWPDSVQDKLDNFNDALLALFIFYVLGVGFSGLGILCCIPAFLMPDKRIIALINVTIASLGAASIALGSIVATAASSIGARAINKAGQRANVVAERGTKFYTISWIAAGFMAISTLFWAGKIVLLARKHKKEQRHNKEAS